MTLWTLAIVVPLLAATGFSLLALVGLLRRPVEPRRPVPWGGAHVLVGLLLLISTLFVFASFAVQRRDGGGANKRTALAINPELAMRGTIGAELLSLGACCAILILGCRATRTDLGFAARHLQGDLRWGLALFAALALPIYLLQWLLTVAEIFPGKHPVEELLNLEQPGLIASTVVAVVLVAPLTEEFFFRVLLQGWLERLWPVSIEPEFVDPLEVPAPSPSSEPPYASPSVPLGRAAVAGGAGTRWYPMLISAAIFAVLHLGWPGPAGLSDFSQVRGDPIPLFFLALVLGYVYQRTHRVWTGLMIHMALNAVSTALLLIGLAAGGGK